MNYSIQNLSVFFPANSFYAVKDISFELKGKTVFALVGETGSGKTMISRAVSGLLPEGAKASGKVLRASENLLCCSEEEMRLLRQKSIAMVFQNASAALNPLLSLKRQLDLAAEKKTVGDCFFDVLQRAGLEASPDFLKKYPFELSGGMKQRFLMAMALLKQPELLILDEPTRGLDDARRMEMIREIQKLHRESDACIFLITHDLFFARLVSTEMAVLYKGNIVERGATEKIFAHPLHPYFRALVQALPENGFQIPKEDFSEYLQRQDFYEAEENHFVRCFLC